MSLDSLISLSGQLVFSMIGEKLILSDQNGSRPEKPYATIAVRTIDPDNAIKWPVDEEGDELVTQQQYSTVEIQFYGSGAYNFAQNLSLKLRFETTGWLAESLNLGISRVVRTMRVPELLNSSQFEERAIVEFTVYDIISAKDRVGLIESTEIECFDHVDTVKKD